MTGVVLVIDAQHGRLSGADRGKQAIAIAFEFDLVKIVSDSNVANLGEVP